MRLESSELVVLGCIHKESLRLAIRWSIGEYD